MSGGCNSFIDILSADVLDGIHPTPKEVKDNSKSTNYCRIADEILDGIHPMEQIKYISTPTINDNRKCSSNKE